MNSIRLSINEQNALNHALDDFQGQVYVFGSRLDLNKRGGDIDILLKPVRSTNHYALKSKIASRFEQELQQSLDIVVYDEQSSFCQEIIKHAKPFDSARV